MSSRAAGGGSAVVEIVDNDRARSRLIDHSGSSTAQTFTGGVYHDVLSGGPKGDFVIYTAFVDSTLSAMDRIRDFSAGGSRCRHRRGPRLRRQGSHHRWGATAR